MRALLVCLALVLLTVACTRAPSEQVVLNPDPCAGIVDADLCYFELTKENQTFACPLIQGERVRSLCYVEAVKWDPQEQHCAQTSAQDRKSCYAELGIAQMDFAWCDKSEGLLVQYCREQVIEARNEPDKCETLAAGVWRNTCFDHFGKLLSDKLLCFKISTDERRDGCVYNVSIATGDVKLCHSIINEVPGNVLAPRYTTAGCVTDIAKATQNMAACDELGDVFNVDVCRYRVAVSTGDVARCDDIRTRDIRQTCVQRLNETVQ